MLVSIQFIGERFEREADVICRMFFEEPTVVFTQAMEAEWKIDVHIHGEQLIHAEAVLTNGHEVYVQTHERESAGPLHSKEWRRRAKQAMSVVMIHALEEATGLIQPWGILTGIRPTKLFHTMLQSGQSVDQVRQVLEHEYLLTAAKVDLLSQIVQTQYEVIPDFHQLNAKEVSIYIGIPFCPTKCAYCTFPAYTINNQVDDFLVGLHEEIRCVGQWLTEHQIGVTTIYLGGGTPTSISAEQMNSLFVTMKQYFPSLSRVRELTVEAGRPDTITPDKIEVMKKWKVDRISINPQSFTEETLEAIGRHHSVAETVEKFKLARQMGLDNINMDLIIGLPGEGVDTFRHSLDETAKLMPESLTVHTLSFKRASAMTKNKEKYPVATREEIEAMMQMTTNWTNEYGYKPYYLYRQKNILGNLENVGYSLAGKESIYNVIIMEEIQTIIGLGCGAVSKLIEPGTSKLTRWPNPKDPKTYIDTYRQLIEQKLETLTSIYAHRLDMPITSK